MSTETIIEWIIGIITAALAVLELVIAVGTATQLGIKLTLMAQACVG